MPIVGQGGDATLNALVRNGAGNPADAVGLSLTIYDPDGDPLIGFPVLEPDIVRDSLGSYHYVWTTDIGQDLGSYQAVWAGLVAGAPAGGTEAVEVVLAGSIVPGTFQWIAPNDYDAIRALLGVIEGSGDLPDAVIEMVPFAPHAELLINLAVEDAVDVIATVEPRFTLLKTAAVYATAALLAESNAKGGYMGLVRGEGSRTSADWQREAAIFWEKYQTLMQRGDEDDGGILFLLPGVGLAGPTRSLVRTSNPWAMYTDAPDF